MVTVKVIRRSSGDSVKGKKVALKVPSGVTSDQWTDSNGEAHFDVSPNHGKVYIDGSSLYEGHLSGRVVVFI